MLSRVAARVLAACAAAAVLAACAGPLRPAPAGSKPAGVPVPHSVGQVKARLLGPGTAPGYKLPGASLLGASRSAAKPVVAPSGPASDVCARFLQPGNVLPTPSLRGYGLIGVLNRAKYAFPPTWYEYLDVYPGTETTSILSEVNRLASGCGRFAWTDATASGARRITSQVAVSPLSGLGGSGGQALYVTARMLGTGRTFAYDWVVIRSGRALLVVWDSGSVASGTGQDAATVQLARDAWQHYAAVR